MPSRRQFVYMTGGVLALGASGLATCQGARGCQRKRGPEYEAETASWLAVIRARGGNGMWMVSRGYHLGDDIIAMATNSPVSHASVLDRDGEHVIEALGKGVVRTPLSTFLHESHRVLLLRPDRWTPERGAGALARANGAVGTGYDFLGIVGVPSSTHFYCSELALWSMGIPVDHPGPQHVMHPRDLDHFGEVLFDSGDRDGDPDF